MFCLKWNHFTIYRAIIRTQWNFTSMTAINAKTFGKSVWNTIPFFGAPQAWRVRGKSTDFWVEAPRFGKNFYITSFEFYLITQWFIAREMYKPVFVLFSELIENSPFQRQIEIATTSTKLIVSLSVIKTFDNFFRGRKNYFQK